MKNVVLFVVLVASLWGCVSDRANRYYRKLPAKPVDKVELLWAKPAQEFTVIADFQARQATPQSMRELAASVGADAVIVATMGATNYRNSETRPRQADESSTYTRIVGTAIIYQRRR